jgi:curved DNA-binding protein CbpA
MANARHAAKLSEGAEAWNAWRAANPGIAPDLSDLKPPAEGRHFDGAQPVDLSGANLRRATLAGADLSHARLANADLSGADLRAANLAHADLGGAHLAGADLSGAWLCGVRSLTQDRIERARGSATTVLPEGLLSPPGWLDKDAAAEPAAASCDKGSGSSSGSPASGTASDKSVGGVEEAEADPHSILGVSPKSSQIEIRAAYLRLVKELHPDGRPRDAGAEDAEERLKRINDAYQALKGSEKRETAKRRRRTRTSAIFMAGIVTSVAPLAVAVIGSAYYAGWLGTSRTETATASGRPGSPENAGTAAVSEVSKKSDASRRTAWTDAHRLGTRKAYERFLADYPEGETAIEARAAIAAIDWADARRIEARTAWTRIEKSRDKEELQRFVAVHPDSEQAGRARDRIAAIDRAEARREEAQKAWELAERSGSRGELQRFAAAFPDSELASLARAKVAAIDRLEKRRGEAERAWAAVGRSGTKAELERFVASYPESEHVAAASERVAALARAEAAARAEAHRAAEAKAWAEAEKEGSREGLERFLAAFPDGENLGRARQALAAAAAAEEAERDNAAWQKAERRHTKAGYSGYLAAHPEGRRAADARVRLADLERAEAKPPAEPVKSAAAPAVRSEAAGGQGWPSADEPFIGADGRIRR